MKYVRQLLIILFVSFLGELLKSIIPLSIPASIYGMVLLFLALELKILKVSDIKETSNFLIEMMALMFVPAGVGLLDSWGAWQQQWNPGNSQGSYRWTGYRLDLSCIKWFLEARLYCLMHLRNLPSQKVKRNKT